MKYIIEFVLITIIVFFVWNIMKRIFFKKFYNLSQKFEAQPKPEQKPDEKLKSGNHGLNWDAETVDYEEVKENEKK